MESHRRRVKVARIDRAREVGHIHNRHLRVARARDRAEKELGAGYAYFLRERPRIFATHVCHGGEACGDYGYDGKEYAHMRVLSLVPLHSPWEPAPGNFTWRSALT